ncbi:MAG: MBL fold metallo-hydrolase [Thioalkalispiraceae bacterium]
MNKSLMHVSWVVLLLVPLLLSNTVIADECKKLQRDHYPADWQLPANAIDTQQLPDIKIDPEAPDHRPLPVYQLLDNTYFVFGNISQLNKENRGLNGNAGFIITDKGVIVIDTLGTPKLGRRLISTIRCLTDKSVKYLIVTHNHPDHAYGATAFQNLPGVTIIAHSGTEDYNHSATLQKSVDYRKELLTKDMQGFKPLQPDQYLNLEPFAKKRITLGEEIIDIYNTGKHHSYGDLLVHQVNQDVLWISDLAFNQRTTFMGDGDSAQILKAQDWLISHFANVKLMVPGHGSAQRAPFPMVKQTHEYVTRMRAAMREAVENGVPMLDAVENVQFKDWQDTRLYESNQRANANFVYREMEKAFFEGF